MKARVVILPLFLAVLCVSGRSQTATPSIAIGTHVLTLGMPESSVLESLGSDFELRHLGTGKVSSWLVEKKIGGIYKVAGNVVFDGHVLTTAIRYWEIDDSSSKSMFYALNEAMHSAERDGLTSCTIATYGGSQMIDSPAGAGSGSLNTREILLDCGLKQIKVTLTLSDAVGVTPSQIEITEWLQRK
jgi:hypothetical protein